MRSKPPRLKKLPVLRSDRKAERFVATADLTDDQVKAILDARMDPRHDHLDALLDAE